MSILQRIFGRRREPVTLRPPASVMGSPLLPAAASHSTRNELLRVVLRDTLTGHGIPTAWVHADVLTTSSRTGEHGLHWRLQIRHWDPRLVVHGVALQNSLIKRLMTFDPLASSWLTGLSWQFALADESQCPPMPEPRTWTTEPKAKPEPAAGTAPLQTAQVEVDEEADARRSLEQLFAIRDEDFRRHAQREAPDGSDATQPMWLGTEPAKL